MTSKLIYDLILIVVIIIVKCITTSILAKSSENESALSSKAQAATKASNQFQEILNENKVDATIKALRGDFAGITGFIAGEFVKIAKANNGVIDIENPTFAKASDSLISV